MRFKPSPFLGCVVAPLVAPMMILLIIMVFGEDLRGNSYEYGIKDIQEMSGIVGLFLLFGAPMAYAITIVVGLPFYLIFKRIGLINFWSITFGSAFVAIFPVLVMSAPRGFNIYNEPEKSSILFYLAIALCGYAAGLVFWFVSGLHSHAHNPSINRDA